MCPSDHRRDIVHPEKLHGILIRILRSLERTHRGHLVGTFNILWVASRVSSSATSLVWRCCSVCRAADSYLSESCPSRSIVSAQAWAQLRATWIRHLDGNCHLAV